jgi:hypothetical protein
MSLVCEVCGQSYGLTHSCPGTLPSVQSSRWVSPSGFAPSYYLRLAVGVARTEDDAILEATRAPEAMLFGVFFWLIGVTLSVGAGFLRATQAGVRLNGVQMVLGLGIGIVFAAALTLAQYATCHFLALWWFDAKGTFLGILQPMLLGSIVTWLVVIPYVGTFAANIWSIAILMRVFEEVDGIGRMKAFALAFGFGVIFWILAISLATSLR